MKKTFLSLLAAVLCLVSCQQASETCAPSVDVRFTVDSPLTVSMGDITRASLSEAAVTNLYVLVDGTLTTSQTSADEFFGSPVVPLEVGQHTLVFVASTTALTLSDGWFSFPDGKVKDTFGKVVQINVTSGMEAQNVTLQRIVTRCTIQIEDALPSKLATVSITQSKGSSTFSASTLLGKADGLITSTSIPSGYAGYTDITVNALSTCPSLTDTYMQDVTVEFKTSSGTSFVNETVTNVQMLANRKTLISGTWLTSSQSHAVSCSADWLEDYNIQK